MSSLETPKKEEMKFAAPSLIITLTDGVRGCNHACEYCFRRYEEDTTPFMSLETAIKGINIYWKMFDLEESEIITPEITLYGEPMLNKHVAMESVNHIRGLDEKRGGAETTIVLNTNATLMTHEFARFAKENNIFVIVSLDGPEKIHDKYRIRRGGGSYGHVIAGLKILQEEGVDTKISMTLTPENLATPENLSIISSLFEMLKGLGIKEIFIGQLLAKGLEIIDKDLTSERIKEYVRKAATTTIEYAEMAKKYGIEEVQTCNKRKNFLHKPDILGGTGIDVICPMHEGQVVLWTDGGIGTCKNMKKETFIGDINTSEEDLLQNIGEIIKKIKSRLPLFNPKCDGCELMKVCSGGCAFSAQEMLGDMMGIDPSTCWFNKELKKQFNEEREEK